MSFFGFSTVFYHFLKIRFKNSGKPVKKLSDVELNQNNQPRVEIRRKKRRNRMRSSSPETREQSPSIPDCSDVPMELVIAIVADANDNSSDSSEEEISTEENGRAWQMHLQQLPHASFLAGFVFVPHQKQQRRMVIFSKII